MSVDHLTKPRNFVLVLLGLAFFAHLPTFFIPVLGSDEPTWLTLSRELIFGDLYTRVSDNKPPFQFQWTWLVSWGAESILALRLFVFIWAFSSAFLIWKIVKRFRSDGWIAETAAVLFALASGLVNRGSYTGERVAIGFLLLSIYLLVCGKRRIIWSGVCFCAAILIKPTALICGFPLIAFLFERNWLSSAKNFASFFLGALAFFVLSFGLTPAPFQISFDESFLLAGRYAAASDWTREGIKDRLANFILVIGLFYLPMVIASLFALPYLLKRWTSISIIVIAFFVFGVLSVSVGFRFYQQYYSFLLPALAVVAAFGLTLKNSDRWSRSILLSQIVIICLVHVGTIYREWSGNNRNWNPHVIEVISKIEKETQPGDFVWISSSLFSGYFFPKTRPATKYLLPLYYTQFQDPCRTDSSQLKENLADPIYRSLLDDLNKTKPRIIFYTQNAANNCSDRYRLENFPTLKAYLEENYQLASRMRLGLFFIRKVEQL